MLMPLKQSVIMKIKKGIEPRQHLQITLHLRQPGLGSTGGGQEKMQQVIVFRLATRTNMQMRIQAM